ncbi:MAG: transcription termination factor NusA [Acidobacteriota bacterium]
MPQVKSPDIDIMQVLQQVSREKSIDMERWISALEDAMASAAKKQHRIKEPVRAQFDPESRGFKAYIVKTVVDEVEDPLAEWTVDEAAEEGHVAAVGEEVHLPLSTEGLGRIAAQSAKQVLYQRIREAEREKIYNEYIGRVGEILNGTVKRFERGDIIVDLGRTEAVVPKSEQSRHERYGQGERIRAVIVDVHTQPKGPQIVLSRTDPRLLVKLFEMEVPEIYDGTVAIKNAVRAPGERAKVAVASRERDVDPVGACVGMKGSRVQAIIRELRGEKIDIIEWSDDLVTFAQSGLAPAKITRVSVTHHGEVPHLDVIVEDEQLSLAIGKRGQNVRLASELIGARIDIKSESDVKDEVADALAKMLEDAFAESGLATGEVAGEDDPIDWDSAPGMGPKTAELFRAAGIETYGDLLDASAEELLEIEGLGPKTIDALLGWVQDRLGLEMAETVDDDDSIATDDDGEGDDFSGDEFMAALSKALRESEEERSAADADDSTDPDDRG